MDKEEATMLAALAEVVTLSHMLLRSPQGVLKESQGVPKDYGSPQGVPKESMGTNPNIMESPRTSQGFPKDFIRSPQGVLVDS